MGLVRITTVLILAAILVLPGRVTAVQDPSEIKLEDLRSVKSNTTKPRQLSSAKASRRKHLKRTEGSNSAAQLAGSIKITSDQPCKLVRDMSEKMGLLASSPHHIHGPEIISATCAGLNVTVACGLSRAEYYTYERLLSRNGEQLLVFEGGESEERVVEKLANHLGLLFRKRDPDSDKLPLTYIFAPFGAWPQELQLTILAAPNAPALPAVSHP